MSNNNNIENLFKNNFERFEIKPSNSLWNKINRKLIVKNFMKFNPRSFNIYYTVVAVAVTSVALYNVLNSDINNKLEQSTDQINNTISEFRADTELKNETFNTNETIDHTTENVNQTNRKIKSTIENDENSNEINEKLHNDLTETDYTAKGEKIDEEKLIEKLAEPLAEFSFSDEAACESAEIQFYNESENCNSYFWEFGDDETSTLTNPTFVFRTAGEYTVTLTVTSGSISKSVSKEIVINEKPVADFTIENSKELFVNDNVSFINNSINYTNCYWDFGDRNTSYNINPNHSYRKQGKYDVELICFSDKNCVDTFNVDDLLIKDSKYDISVPTGFTPNISGATNGYWKSNSYSNNIFYPIFNTEVSEFSFKVYSKFGTKVFESNDPNYGWNGYFKNQAVEENVYVWRLSGKFADGGVFNKTGNVTLLYLRN